MPLLDVFHQRDGKDARCERGTIDARTDVVGERVSQRRTRDDEESNGSARRGEGATRGENR